MKKHWDRALVTGASSGIGREMARLLAGAGTDLVVVARDTERLEALADELAVEVEVITADLSVPSSLGKVAARIRQDDAPVDLVINNAGLGFSGEFAEIPIEQARLVADVNVTALHELCHAAADSLRRRGGGTILNVSSIAGDLPGSSSATYNATKAFVTSLSQSLYVELRPHGVTVSCLCPGLTRTEFQDRGEVDVSKLPDVVWQSAETVAHRALEGAAAGKPIVITGAINKVASRLARTVPRLLAREVAARSNRASKPPTDT